jgi:sugar/nucleoside kinase (ribokinase family)
MLRARVVHVDDDDPELAIAVATRARAATTPVTSDLEHVHDRAEELMSTVSHPILNEHLAVAMTGERDSERSLRKLRRMNPGLICVTLGAIGAAALDGDRFYMSPAAPVKVRDATGAGDVFRGGYIYALLQGCATPDILRIANAAAAVSCTRLGALAGVPTRDEASTISAAR